MHFTQSPHRFNTQPTPYPSKAEIFRGEMIRLSGLI